MLRSSRVRADIIISRQIFIEGPIQVESAAIDELHDRIGKDRLAG
jgi:hypothetical protein